MFLYCAECSGTTREAGKGCGWMHWRRWGSNWLFAWMSSVTTPALGRPVLCPVVICREFGVVGSCSSETHQAVFFLLFHIKLNFFAVVRGRLVAFPPSARPLHISVGWCLATPSATQILSSRKQHGKVCGANMIYWFIFHFTDIWDGWLFPQIVCRQSHRNILVSRGKGSWKVHNRLIGIHAPLMGTRENCMTARGFGWFGWGFFGCLHTGDCSPSLPESYKTRQVWDLNLEL